MTRTALTVCLLALAFLTGCFESTSGGGAATSRAVVTTTTTAPLAASVPWVPTANEVEPELKQAAADTLSALFSYEVGGGTAEAAAGRLATVPAEADVASEAAALLDPNATGAVDVIYPQMGGFSGGRASAMVVTRLRWRTDGVDRTEVRTVDVRLVREAGVWKVENLASLGGSPPAQDATLSALAQSVLEHPKIDLPDSARWDIRAGLISDRVLEAMTSLADVHEIKVGVLSTGHPLQVFGTGHTSNHIPGRAVDIWWLDGPIVEQRDPNGPLVPVIRKLLDSGVTELGAPFVVEGSRGGAFANLVHQDHLHVGFDAA